MRARKADQDFFDNLDLPIQSFLDGKLTELRKSSALRGKYATQSDRWRRQRQVEQTTRYNQKCRLQALAFQALFGFPSKGP